MKSRLKQALKSRQETKLRNKNGGQGLDNNNVAEAVEQVKIKFNHRYPYLSWEDVEWFYQTALDYYLSLAFPLKHDIAEIPASRIGDLRYIRSIMQDVIERQGLTSVTAYSENGMSYTFDGAMFNDKYASLIVPCGKVIVL